MGAMSTRFPRSLACAWALAAAASAGAEPAVIGLARAYLGPDSTLDSVQAIHFSGTLDRSDPDHAERGIEHATFDLIVAKPARQRQIVHGAKATETTVLDGYEAWDYLEDNADPSRHVMTWLKATDIKGLQASTRENLYFFRGLSGEGAVVDRGPATIDGVTCERVDFVHSPAVVFERFFDRDSGRLVSTLVGNETVREAGEVRVDGIRFPKTVVSSKKTASGKDLVSTVTFERIVLNEPQGPSTFAVPAAPPPKAASVAAGPPAK
jgi:hypothetical protein